MIKNSVRQKQKQREKQLAQEQQWRWLEREPTPSTSKQWDAVNDGAVSTKFLQNELYTVFVTRFQDGTARLTIIDPNRRHDWQHYQRIKNELLGADWEGVELYPQVSRVVDEAEMYHLWCRPAPFNIGWNHGGSITANGTFYGEKTTPTVSAAATPATTAQPASGASVGNATGRPVEAASASVAIAGADD